MVGALPIALLLTLGRESHPELVFAGLLSFALTVAAIMPVAMVLGIVQAFYMRRKYPEAWQAANSRSLSPRKRFAAQADLHAITDPFLERLSKVGLRVGVVLLSTWCVIYLVLSIGVLAFDFQPFKELLRGLK